MCSEQAQVPERMDSFFDRRSGEYDEHMQESLDSFEAFYEAVAQPIPRTEDEVQILDIGCGTGLEFAPILQRAPNAQIAGIDLSASMLECCRGKYPSHLAQLTLIRGSYLEIPLGKARYHYAVSVMTLHHLKPERKGKVYGRIRRALRAGGAYIEGDYVVSKEKAAHLLAEYRRKMARVEEREEGIHHIDIPLTVEMQQELLLGAGFATVDLIWQEGEAVVYLART
ncbi:MAG: methyltransferase domain-containing protein [Anaerolineae bacterium]